MKRNGDRVTNSFDNSLFRCFAESEASWDEWWTYDGISGKSLIHVNPSVIQLTGEDFQCVSTREITKHQDSNEYIYTRSSIYTYTSLKKKKERKKGRNKIIFKKGKL